MMLIFLIAVRAGGAIAGIAAALIMGLSPTQIAFSQEARSYMLMIFFLLLALLGLTCLALNRERAALPWRMAGWDGTGYNSSQVPPRHFAPWAIACPGCYRPV